MKKLLLAGWLLCGAPGGAAAQTIEAVLQSIERNNSALQALRQENEAAKLEVRAQNNLEDPSVEYSPFYTKGTDGMASSELVVSQGFDFPTLYATRHKSGRLQQEALDGAWRVARRDLLLSAQQLCLDLIRLNQERTLLEQRQRNAEELLLFFEKRLAEGDATIIEVNKIRMERMNVQTEMAQNEAARHTALQSLRAMNGDRPVVFDLAEYPAATPLSEADAQREKLFDAELELQAAESAVQAAAQEVRVTRQNWLPKLQVGYRRNTALDEASNGFLVGASFPLFSNRHKAGIARARHAASQSQFDNVRLQTEARIRSQFAEAEQLQRTLDTYDVALMRNTLTLLRRAVESGQLSLIEYYTEADGIYRNLQSYTALENQYRKLLAELRKNEL